MHSPLPFLRLANRPLVWMGLVWATFPFTMLSLPPDFPWTGPQWNDPSGPWFWRLAIAFPAATGLVLGFVRVDLFKGSFAWPLPGLTTRLSLALAVSGLAVSMPMTVVAVTGGRLAVAVAALGLGLLAFAMACVAMEVFESISLVMIATALGAVWYMAPQLSGMAFANPLVLGAISLTLATWLYRRHHGPNAVRALLEFLRVPPDPAILRWLNGNVVRTSREATLHAAGNMAWARAVMNESPFGRGRNLLILFGLLTGLDWMLTPDGSASTALMLFALASSLWPMLPRRSQLYPISRRRRAAVAWIAAMLTATTFWLAIVAWTAFYSWLGIALLGTGRSVVDDLDPLIFQMVWYPVALWPAVRHELSITGSSQGFLRSAVGSTARIGSSMLLFMVLTLGTSLAIGRVDSLTLQVTTGLLLAAAVQIAFFAALRRFFLTGDLR